MPSPKVIQQRAYGIFEAALSLPESERESYIRTQTGGDELLAAEVNALSRADKSDALNTRGFHRIGLTTPTDYLGREVGHYRLVEYIGGGGMGLVYRGERTDDIAQRVAIKLIRQELRSATSRARFDIERTALARLEHPAIARLIDAGVTDDKLPWYVMEFVEGLPIDRYCDEKQLSLDARLRLLMSVCNAVDSAHRALIVHRDIKPGNILVTAAGEPKLIDFGIAKHMGDESNSELTRDTGTLFTSHYAAPEQVSGQEVTTATDVFGLGALAYRVLVGQRIFASSVKTDYDYLSVVTQRDVELPSKVANNKALRGDLDNILCTALARDPGRRYASAADLAAEFNRYLKHLPIQAHAPSFAYKTRKFLQRNTLAATLGGLVVVASTIGLAGYVQQAREVATQRDRAQAEAERARFEAARSQQVNGFLTSMLEAADPRLGNKDVTVASVLDGAVAKVDKTMAEDPDLAGAVLMTLAHSNASISRFKQAEEAAARSINYYRKTNQHELEIAVAEGHRGEWLGLAGDAVAGEAVARIAIKELDRLASGSLAQAEAQRHLATVIGNAGKVAEAEQLFEKAIATLRRVNVRDMQMARTVNDYAVILGSSGRVKEALPLHREAVEIAVKEMGEDSPYVDDVRSGLAGALGFVGEIEESLGVFSKIAERRVRILGPTHQDTLWSQAAVANALNDLNRFAQAEPIVSKAFEELLKSFGPANQITLYAEVNLGRAQCGNGKYDAGIARLREVAERRLKLYGPDHWLPANSNVLLARCMIKAKRYPAAEQLLLPAVALLERTQGPEFQRTQEAYGDLVELYARTNRAAEAQEWKGKLIAKR
jgi:eukaryotic-like serine/threonine-protein kinase